MLSGYGSLRFTFLYAYLDDILVPSANEEDHLEHLRQIFERLSTFELDPLKSVFGKKELEYLGYLIDQHGTRPISTRVDTSSKRSTNLAGLFGSS